MTYDTPADVYRALRSGVELLPLNPYAGFPVRPVRLCRSVITFAEWPGENAIAISELPPAMTDGKPDWSTTP